MSHCIRDDPKIFQPKLIVRDCDITLSTETDRVGCSIPPKTPLRTLRKGDKITVSGFDNSRYFFFLGDEDGEKVSALHGELDKVFVED